MIAATVPAPCESMPVAGVRDEDERAGLAMYKLGLDGIRAPRAVDVREIFSADWHGITTGLS